MQKSGRSASEEKVLVAQSAISPKVEKSAGYVVLIVSETFPNESVLRSDALLPIQLYGERRGSASMEPLKNLMTAVLADAIRC
jgi:hypothetical protein